MYNRKRQLRNHLEYNNIDIIHVLRYKSQLTIKLVWNLVAKLRPTNVLISYCIRFAINQLFQVTLCSLHNSLLDVTKIGFYLYLFHGLIYARLRYALLNVGLTEVVSREAFEADLPKVHERDAKTTSVKKKRKRALSTGGVRTTEKLRKKKKKKGAIS